MLCEHCILASRRPTRLYTPCGATDMVVGQRVRYPITLSAACKSHVTSSHHVQPSMEKCWMHQNKVRMSELSHHVAVGFDSVSLSRLRRVFSRSIPTSGSHFQGLLVTISKHLHRQVHHDLSCTCSHQTRGKCTFLEYHPAQPRFRS